MKFFNFQSICLSFSEIFWVSVKFSSFFKAGFALSKPQSYIADNEWQIAYSFPGSNWWFSCRYLELLNKTHHPINYSSLKKILQCSDDITNNLFVILQLVDHGILWNNPNDRNFKSFHSLAFSSWNVMLLVSHVVIIIHGI